MCVQSTQDTHEAAKRPGAEPEAENADTDRRCPRPMCAAGVLGGACTSLLKCTHTGVRTHKQHLEMTHYTTPDSRCPLPRPALATEGQLTPSPEVEAAPPQRRWQGQKEQQHCPRSSSRQTHRSARPREGRMAESVASPPFLARSDATDAAAVAPHCQQERDISTA